MSDIPKEKYQRVAVQLANEEGIEKTPAECESILASGLKKIREFMHSRGFQTPESDQELINQINSSKQLAATRQRFETEYTKQFPNAIFGRNYVSMLCTCEDGGGPTHWAAVRNTPEAIDLHRDHERVLDELRKL